MGKKYIIELLDDCQSEFKGILTFGVTQEKQISVELIPKEDLTPYTEPDLEQVRRDYDAYYEKGLDDAWEAARKISLAKIDGGFSWESMNNMFGTDSPSKIYKTFTASEAIEKIRQYEQEKEEIKVGDEVELILNGEVDSKAVFLEDDEGYYRCLFWTGCCFTTLSYPKEKFRKTGRHFDEIATILEKMRGEQDG